MRVLFFIFAILFTLQASPASAEITTKDILVEQKHPGEVLEITQGVDKLRADLKIEPKQKLQKQYYAQACCKYCKKGKPCGDSCISRSKTCHKGKGCACAR